MLVKREGLPVFWASWLADALVGDAPCLLRPYLRGHYNVSKRSEGEAVASWKVRHTELLQAEADRLQKDGWKLSVERYMRVTGVSAIIAGKPDIIQQKKDCRPKIVDVKGGKEKASHVAQVQIYMVLVPMAWRSPSMIFAGEVVYADHRVPVSPESAQALKPKLTKLIKQLAIGHQPSPSPSESACRFCESSVETCPERWTAGQDAVQTEEW